MANKLARQGAKIFRGKGGKWRQGSGGFHGRDTCAGFQVDECYCNSQWAFIVNQSNTAAIAPAGHDMALFQRQDVASIKIVDVGDSNALALAAGDGNSTISSVNTLRFYTGGNMLCHPYSGMTGGLALCIGADQTAMFCKNVTACCNITVGGDLIIQGTTTTLNTTNLLVEDPLVVLSKNQSGTPTFDSGILVERGSSNNVAFIWDESADEFAVTCTSDAGAGAGNINMGGYQNLKASSLCATSSVRIGDAVNLSQFNGTGTRLKICGTGDNSMYVGPNNDDSWGYIYSTNNSAGIYFGLNQGNFQFDTGHLGSYTDQEVDIGYPSHQFRCGSFSCNIYGKVLCGTSCVDAAVVKIPGTQTIELASTTHSLKVKNLDNASSSGLVLQGSGGAHHMQLYGTGTQYGFLDGAWAGWDIRKTSNGNLDVWVGGAGFICACEGGVIAATCVAAPKVFPTTCLQFDQTGTRSWYMCAAGGYLGIHSGDGAGTVYSQIPITIKGTGNNSGKSDFTVHTGGDASLAFSGGEVRMGDSDVNWSTAVRRSGSFETYGQPLQLKVVEGNRNINFCPSGSGIVCTAAIFCSATCLAGKKTILDSSGNYVWCATCTAGSYSPTGVRTSFVHAPMGWPQYGTVLHVGGRGGGDAGGDFQLYMGHGHNYGKTHLQVRSANNDASPSDSWTTWKTLLDTCNIGCDGAPNICGTTLVQGPMVCGSTCVHAEVLRVNSCLMLSGGGSRIWVNNRRQLEGSADGSVTQLSEDFTCLRLHGLVYACTCLQSPILCAQSHVRIGSHCICCIAGSDYIEFSGWTRFKPGLGVYSSANSAHFYPNNASDKGAWRMDGVKGGYGGLYSCGLTFMGSADCGHGGLYNDIDNEWYFCAARNGTSTMYHNNCPTITAYTNGACICANGAMMQIYPHGSWNHLQGSGTNFYFNCPIYVDTGKIGSYNEDLQLHHSGTTYACMSTSCFCSANLICAANCMKTYDICATRFIKSSNDINSGGCIIAASKLCAPHVCATTSFYGSGKCIKNIWHGGGSDFADGTLVTTDIPSSSTNGESYVLEVTGKSYSSSRPPFSFMAQGYLYNDTVIATSGVNLSGHRELTYVKVMNCNGNLAFWWPRIGYWNSFSARVCAANSGCNTENRVTNVYNSVDPSGATKKVTICLQRSYTSDNFVNGNQLVFSNTVGSGQATIGLKTSPLFCGTTCIHADGDSKLRFENAGGGAIMMKADSGHELYIASNAAANGNVRFPSAGGLDATSGVVKGPIVCATSCVIATNWVCVSSGHMCAATNMYAGACLISQCGLYGAHASWSGEQNKIQWHASHLYFQNTGGGYLGIFRRTDGSNRLIITNDGSLCTIGFICSDSCICGQHICAHASSGYTMRTAGCIYANSHIVAAGEVIGTGIVCSTTCVQTPILHATNCICVAGGGHFYGRQNFRNNDTSNHDEIGNATGSQGAFEVYNNGSGNDAFFAFHIGGQYATYFGLDSSNNRLTVGGWSAGTAKYHLTCDGQGTLSTTSSLCTAIVCATNCMKVTNAISTGFGTHCGLGIGSDYVNNGGWDTQLNMYGGSHVMARWCKASGDAADNAQFGCIWLHNSHPMTITSSGNMRLCATGTVKICLTSAKTCVHGCLVSTTNIRGEEVCSGSWFRNESSGEGLYNSATTQHFYSDHDDWWNIGGGDACNGLRFRDTHAATIRGSIWANNSNQLFLSDSGGAVRVLVNTSTDIRLCNTTCVYGTLWGNGQICAAGEIRSNAHICSVSNNNTTTVPSRFYASQDGYLRYYDRNHFKNHLGLTGKWNCSRSQSTSDQNYWVGSMGWGAQCFNTAFTWGSGFLDLWSNPGQQPSGTSHWNTVQALHYACSTTGSAGTYGWQLTVGAGNPSLMYIRGAWGSTPTSWYKVWNALNDGAGSGLDADLLDGQQGSYYYAASNPSGYTTCTGDITNVAAGGGMSGGGSSGSVTITHADTSSQGSVNNSGSNFIQDVTLDTYGHVTGLTTAAAGGGGTDTCENLTCLGLYLGCCAGKYQGHATNGNFCVSPGAGNVVVGPKAFYGNLYTQDTPDRGDYFCGSTQNTIVGALALHHGTRSGANVVIGYCALYCTRSWGNGEFGGTSGPEIYGSVVIGHGALAGANSHCCGRPDTVGDNVYIGRSAGYYSGPNVCRNVVIGRGAAYGYNGNNCMSIKCNTILGAYTAGNNIKYFCNNIIIGHDVDAPNSCCCNFIAIGNSNNGGNGGCGKMCSKCFAFSGSVSKSSGSFLIAHPDPVKTETKDLWHSFVESPNEGDNIYRYSVSVVDCCNVITLPDYYNSLNKDDQVWVSPVGHFGAAYACVTEDQKCAIVCTNADGCYNVLVIGTRKDPAAVEAWHGAERDINGMSPFVEEENVEDEDEASETFGDTLYINYTRTLSAYQAAYGLDS